MNWGLVILLVGLLLAAVVGTLVIGFSKENREENPRYDQASGRNMMRLTIYYVIAAIVSVLVFVIWLKS